MYTIFCDNYLLHSDLDDYRLLNVQLTMEVNTAGSLSFSILPDHPNLFALTKLKSEVVVKKNGIVYWKGRIVDDIQSLDKVHEVYCEGKLKALGDTLVRPQVFDDTANDVLTQYINLHNSQSAQQFKLGTLSLTNDIYRDLKNYESTYDRVQDLIKSVGGYLFIRYESDGDYLDWVTDFVTTSTQQITLGENILNLTQDVSAEKTYTACIPLGAKLVDENGSATETRLTVESIQGVDYVFNQDKVNEFGWIFAPIGETTWDDVTTASALLTRGNDFLTDSVKLALTLELTALDLSYTDTDIDSFNFCEYVSVNSTYHGIIEDYLLSKIQVDISNPANTKITLGESVLSLTDKTKSDKDNVTFTINELQTVLIGTGAEVGAEIAGRERYIRYADGVIELGETGSDLKMKLSNTKLSFVESIGGVETEVAYISNPTGEPGDSKLYIENAEILQAIAFGTYAWEPENNGSVSLTYKG